MPLNGPLKAQTSRSSRDCSHHWRISPGPNNVLGGTCNHMNSKPKGAGKGRLVWVPSTRLILESSFASSINRLNFVPPVSRTRPPVLPLCLDFHADDGAL